jgi:hypothetical protein
MITYVDNASQLMETLIWDVAQDIWELFMWYNRLSLAKKVYGSNKVEVEPKRFEKVGYFEDPYSNYQTVFPTRFMDWAMIYGSEYLYKKLYYIFADDLSKATSHHLGLFKSRIKYAADISNHWEKIFKGNNVQHFDREKKEIYYQKTPLVETGVKMWPLRYVQYKLAYLIIQLIKTNKIAYKDFKELEWFMHKKIEFLRNYVKWGMSEHIIQDLSIIYYTFLKIHHICQKECRNTEGEYIYHLKWDKEKMLKEMLMKLDTILSELAIS